jgi:hypothetical protein
MEELNVVNFVWFVLVVIFLGLTTERGAELVKQLLRWVAEKYPKLYIAGRQSFILAAAVAFFITYYFGVDMTAILSAFEGFDPELVKLVNALLLTLVSNKLHDGLVALVSMLATLVMVKKRQWENAFTRLCVTLFYLLLTAMPFLPIEVARIMNRWFWVLVFGVEILWFVTTRFLKWRGRGR